MISIYDPRGTRDAATVTMAPRLRTLAGATIGLLDNGKENADALLSRARELLKARGARIVMASKPSFSRVAPDAVLDELAHCNAVVAAHGG